ncbi:MAG: type secretion outer membrane protein, TolC family [Acidobacteria bacterium]|nr:type secretion outer membrane protein, TolC family [Acidobacteriota bacterium]
MRRFVLSCTLVVVAFAGAAPTDAHAQSVSDARLAELMRDAATQSGYVTGAQGPGASAVDLTVDEAVTRALDRNLDIAVERINPQTYDLTIASLRGTYQPVVTSTIGRNYIVQLPTSQLIGGVRVENTTGTANVGTNWSLPWYGSSVTVGFNNRKQDSTNLFTTFTPQYNATLSFGVVQPLLRGFKIDLTRQQLEVQTLNRDISEIQLQSTLVNTVANVRNAYWDLVAAREAVEVARRSLALAEKLVEDNQVRVEVGTLAPIDVYQAESEAATRRQSLAQADQTLKTAELALKRLIVSGTDDPMWPAIIVPVDRPDFRPVPIDLTGAVRSALEGRTDLRQARKQLDSSLVNVDYLGNQRLPALDFQAGYGLQGIGGTRYIREGTGGPVIAVIPGGYGDAVSMMGAADYPQWNASVVMSYPLGTSAADAQHARAKLQVSQARARIRALELQVATEVTNIASQIESNLRRVEAATAARELAQKRLEAEESKFEVGMSTNFFVVQAQRDLFDAQIVELRARLDYQKSIVDFDRVQQTASRGSTSAASSATLGGGSQ